MFRTSCWSTLFILSTLICAKIGPPRYIQDVALPVLFPSLFLYTHFKHVRGNGNVFSGWRLEAVENVGRRGIKFIF